MASLNKVLLMGNLTREPELKYTTNGSAVCEFGMAINRTYTSNNEKKEDVCYVDVNVWGRQAEACSRYLQKGAPLFVEGRLQFDQWNDKDSGKSRSKLRVVAERTQFLGNSGRKSDDGGDQDSYYNTDNSANQPPNQQMPGNNTGFNNNNQSPAPAGNPSAPAQIPPPPVPAPAPAAPPEPPSPGQQQQPPAMPSAQQKAFNPNMGSEDDIPF